MITRRSKLEMHIDVLRVLARDGPLKLTHIMYKSSVACSVLKPYLDLLIQHNLAKEQLLCARKRVVYTITEKGLTVLKYFREIDSALQITEDTRKIPALLCLRKSARNRVPANSIFNEQ